MKMKTAWIVAAVALALPALAAEDAKTAPRQPQPEKTAPAAKDRAAPAAEENVAEEEDTLVLGKKTEKRANGGHDATKPETRTLRFERWVYDEDNDY